MAGRVAHMQQRMSDSAHANARYKGHVRQTCDESGDTHEYDHDTYSASRGCGAIQSSTRKRQSNLIVVVIYLLMTDSSVSSRRRFNTNDKHSTITICGNHMTSAKIIFHPTWWQAYRLQIQSPPALNTTK